MLSKRMTMQFMRNIAMWDKGLRHPRSLVVRGVVSYRVRTGRIGPTPNFLIIGTQRGGTTHLYHVLLGHPQVFPCIVKEPHYFDKHYARGSDWYRAHFSPSLQQETNGTSADYITGEATPCYMFRQEAPGRIHSSMPETKLIVLLRNPVDRAVSQYRLARRWGTEPLSFEEAIEIELEFIRNYESPTGATESPATVNAPRSYVARGLYADQLRRWMTYFPSDQLLILQSEHLYRDAGRVVSDVTDFLGLSGWEPDLTYRGRKLAQVSVSQDVLQELEAFYRPHNQDLYELLGRRFDWNDA